MSEEKTNNNNNHDHHHHDYDDHDHQHCHGHDHHHHQHDEHEHVHHDHHHHHHHHSDNMLSYQQQHYFPQHNHSSCCSHHHGHEHEEKSDFQYIPKVINRSYQIEKEFFIDNIKYMQYKDETQMSHIMNLITKDLSEPYSIYTYRYFIHNWPHLSYLVSISLLKHTSHLATLLTIIPSFLYRLWTTMSTSA